MRRARIGAAAAALAVLALHIDLWNRPPRLAPLLGWIPADVAYHVAWVAAASLVLWLTLRVTWPAPPR